MELKELLDVAGEHIGWLQSIQVGRPREQVTERPVDGREQVWLSGIYKQSVTGQVRLGKTNLDGDGQADLKNHGGPYRAVLMYSADHYCKWGDELTGAGIDWPAFAPASTGVSADSRDGRQAIGENGDDDSEADPAETFSGPFAPGAFGENFTVSGLTEDTVCIGDILRIGEVVVQVSQPRNPCWKLGRRHGTPELPALVERLGWTGWYVRPLVTGAVEPGAAVSLIMRLYPEWTIRETHRIRNDRANLREEAARLAACEELSPDWRHILATFE